MQEDSGHAVIKDVPFTSRQPIMSEANLTFTSHQETTLRNGIRRKPRNKAVITKTQGRKLTTSTNTLQNPF